MSSNDDSVPVIDCDNCMDILEYLSKKEKDEWVDMVVLDGAMRTGGSATTTPYHVREHLANHQFVETTQRGTFRRRSMVRITEKGRKSFEKTREDKGSAKGGT